MAVGLPPHPSVWVRFSRWRLRAVPDRVLAVLVTCRRQVGQTFGCLQRHRRLRVDDRASLATSRAMLMSGAKPATGGSARSR